MQNLVLRSNLADFSLFGDETGDRAVRSESHTLMIVFKVVQLSFKGAITFGVYRVSNDRKKRSELIRDHTRFGWFLGGAPGATVRI